KRAASGDETLHLLERQLAFVKGSAYNHRKNAHFLELLDIVNGADSPAGEDAKVGKSLLQIFIKVEGGSFEQPIPVDIGGFDVLESLVVKMLNMIKKVDVGFSAPAFYKHLVVHRVGAKRHFLPAVRH